MVIIPFITRMAQSTQTLLLNPVQSSPDLSSLRSPEIGNKFVWDQLTPNLCGEQIGAAIPGLHKKSTRPASNDIIRRNETNARTGIDHVGSSNKWKNNDCVDVKTSAMDVLKAVRIVKGTTTTVTLLTTTTNLLRLSKYYLHPRQNNQCFIRLIFARWELLLRQMWKDIYFKNRVKNNYVLNYS